MSENPEGYNSIYLRIVDKLNNMIQTILKAKYFQLAQLNSDKKHGIRAIGIPEGLRLILSTQGFGLLGERFPISQENLKAYSNLLLIHKTIIEKYGGNKEIEFFEQFLRTVEDALLARSHKQDTILGYVAEAVNELATAVRKVGIRAREEPKSSEGGSG